MKIPIFEEILLKDITFHHLHQLVVDSRIGKVPCYVNLSTYGVADLETIIDHFEKIFFEESIHPRFPYPFYIITSKAVLSPFPHVKSVKDLPEHYFKKIKRPNNKDLQLLNKISLKVDKIKNLDLFKITDKFKTTAPPQRVLYETTKELHFLEFLNSLLLEDPKDKNRGER